MFKATADGQETGMAPSVGALHRKGSACRGRLVRAFIGLLAAASAVAGHAEDRPAPDYFDVASMHNFAHCVVNRTRPGAEKLLAMNFDEDAYAAALRSLVKGHEPCLGARMKISGVLFAGSIAEDMLTRDMSKDKLAGLLHPADPPLDARSDTELTGLCMALKFPGETSALLYSDPASDQLVMQYAQLLPQCVRQGQQLRINKLGLRAIAALAAYRIAEANGGEGSRAHA